MEVIFLAKPLLQRIGTATAAVGTGTTNTKVMISAAVVPGPADNKPTVTGASIAS